MQTFKIRVAGESYYPEVMVFSGGEVNVTLPSHFPPVVYNLVVQARLRNAEDIISLMMIKDALDRHIRAKYSATLSLHYVPYARQDRVCNEGEALSIKVFADLVNSMGFDTVYTLDNHSEVSTALINNVANIPVENILERNLPWDLVSEDLVLCSPDAGANKKSYNVAKALGISEVIRADKRRDVSTGKITGTEVFCGDLEGKNVLVVDDICDGGYTFIKLAEKLKEKNAGDLYLYVTHGIFSKGVDCLIEAGYSRVFTTNSFYRGTSDSQVSIIKL